MRPAAAAGIRRGGAPPGDGRGGAVPPVAPKGTRTDIQALRGIAILLVLLHHAQFGVKAGYLGVDVFFVVSGFLITTLVKDGVTRGTFSFAEFYLRRAKRLLPGAYVTFGATALLSLVLLSRTELEDFAKQLFGAVTFTGNIALWRQVGYFGSAADLKPLLHVWSLGIEEQYYLLLPAALVLVPRRFWVAGAAAVIGVSAALCVLGASWRPVAAFYLLPTRAWELGLGSIGALSAGRFERPAALLYWPALVALFAVTVVPIGGAHPGPSAAVICVSTLLVVLARREGVANSAPGRWLARVGDYSYSLYLVHWPILALANNVWIGEMPAWVKLPLLGAAFPVAYLLYRYVENPARHARFDVSGRRLLGALAVSAALVLIPYGRLVGHSREAALASSRRVNYGLAEACEFKTDFSPRPECKTSQAPAMLVWGDSYAMHLVPGIAETSGSMGVLQATRSTCGPILGAGPVSLDVGSEDNAAWARRCIDFNESVLQYLAAQKSVKVVVLASPFDQYVDADKWGMLTGGGYAQAGVDDAVSRMRDTVNRIRALGKRVVVVAPPPSSGFDIGDCLERRATGRWNAGPNAGCEVSQPLYQSKRGKVLELLSRLPKEAGVEVVRFDDFLCAQGVCKTSLEGHWLFRDAGHLSREGSVLLATHTHLVRELLDHAH